MPIRLPLTRLFLSLFFLSACLFVANAQDLPQPDFTIKGVAIGISAPELIDQMMVIMPGLGSNAKAMMNEQSVKPYLMPPRNVGQRGTVMSYALATCLEFYANFDQNYKVNLSPDFLSRKLAQEGSADVKNALRLLVTDGTVSADALPYDAPQMRTEEANAKKYQIANYLQIFGANHRNTQKVFEAQKALMRGNPVVVELSVPKSFREIKDLRFWSNTGEPGGTPVPFVVVGYNMELEAFEVQSSWGTNWASDGYLWLDFKDFGEMAKGGYVMVPR